VEAAVKQVTRINNHGKGRLLLAIEPWGEQIFLEAGESCDVLFTSPITEAADIAVNDGHIAIYAERIADMAVFLRGHYVAPHCDPAEQVKAEEEYRLWLAERGPEYPRPTWQQ
jgi:hypothetical protein